MTERYAHLLPDSFFDRDRGTIPLDLVRPGGEVVALEEAKSGAVGHPMDTDEISDMPQSGPQSGNTVRRSRP